MSNFCLPKDNGQKFICRTDDLIPSDIDVQIDFLRSVFELDTKRKAELATFPH